MATAETARLITALELQDKFSKPIENAGRSLGQFEDRAKRLDKLGFTIGRGLGQAAHNISLIGIAAGGLVVGGLVASVNAASDLNESINKADVVFGQFADKIHAFGQTAASALGLSRQQAEESASSFGNLFKVVGLTDDASADMSIRLVKLAGDIASFNNIDPAEALEKLRSGLIGEAEPLRSVGVLLTEAAVQEEAYASGLAERGKKLTEGQKVQARYNLILKQTTTAQGDFARTSSGLANQQRILKAQLTDTAAVIGTALLPTVNKLLLKFTTLLTEHQPDIQRFADSLPGVADRVEAVLGGLPWDSIGSAFKLLGDGAKAALEAFESAPPWLQTAILTGWGLNKLTGGALGSIVGQLGSGLIKGVLGMNAGVVNINAGVVNGGVGPGGPTPGGFNWKSLIPWLGGAIILGAVAAGAEFALSPDRSPEFGSLEGRGGPGRNPRGRDPLDDNTDAVLDNTNAVRENTPTGGRHGPEGPTPPKPLPLDDAALISALEKTSEFGKAGVGTTIEHGPLTGTDPFGEEALRLFQRAEFPKQGRTLGEIERHIIAAEEVQAEYLKTGDLTSATRTQAVIDGLHALLGTTDKTVPAITRLQEITRTLPPFLQRIVDKNWAPILNVTIPTTVNLSLRTISTSLNTYRVSGSGVTGGFTESAF